jgi:hypothetical protein
VKLKKLIFELEKLREKHGNVNVVVQDLSRSYDYWDLSSVEPVEVYRRDPEYMDEDDAPYFDDDGKGNIEMAAIVPATTHVTERMVKK